MKGSIMSETVKNYLQEYDNAAEADKYPLVQKWMKTEPLPFFKQLRAERPILVTPQCTLVALFTDVRDALEMPKIFTVDLYKPKMGVTDKEEGYLMAHDDDALHYREKSLMQGFLNRDDLPVVRKLIGDVSKKILDAADGNIEIVNRYCRMVPAYLVQDYFGLDGIGKKNLIKWSFWNQYDAFHNQPFDLNSKEKFDHIVEEHDKVSQELVAYLIVLMGRKALRAKIEGRLNLLLTPWRLIKWLFNKILHREPEVKYDMVMRMLRSTFDKEVDFPLTRIANNVGGLLIGSIETTSQAVSQSIQYLLDRPDLLNKAKAAALLESPEKFDAIVWETLRYVPISPYMFRQVSEDYTLAKGTERETKITAGTNVLLLSQSAMFDTYAFEKPDEFNINRNGYHNFTFGFGSHHCLGKYIGMEMIPEMVRQVVLRQNITSEGSIDYKEGPFPEEYNINWS